MTRMHRYLALMACTAMGASGTLYAQARGPAPGGARSDDKKVEIREEALDEAARARKMSELNAWLRRLVGRFRMEGRFGRWNDSVVGTAECVSIGEGPGVHCLYNATFEMSRSEKLQEDPTFRNVVQHRVLILYGIDPDALAIQEFWVTDHVEGRTGLLKDDAVAFTIDPWGGSKGGCKTFVYSVCGGASQVIAKSESDVIMKFRFGTPDAATGELHFIRQPSGRL